MGSKHQATGCPYHYADPRYMHWYYENVLRKPNAKRRMRSQKQ